MDPDAGHLAAGDVQRFLHDELPVAERLALGAHVESCHLCQAAVARAREEERILGGLLDVLDHPHPRRDVRDIHRLARQSARYPLQRWAAGIVVAVTLTGAAFAFPSSPLRRWIGSARSESPTVTLPAVPDTASVGSEDLAGVTITPGGNATVLEFRANQAEGELRIVLTDSVSLDVRSPVGSASFSAGSGGITVENLGARVSYDIRIPRSAPRVEIRIAGVSVWSKHGDRIIGGEARDADGVMRVAFPR